MRTRSFAAAMVLVGTLAMLGLGDGCTRRQMRRDWNQVTGREAQVNLNTASRSELAQLPGITDKDAQRIIDHRPYDNKSQLVSKNVLGQRKYDDIADMVYVRR